MARVGAEGSKYPPSEFSQKYAPVLAPKGKLVSPADVFGESGMYGKDVEDKTKQAFKVSLFLNAHNAPPYCTKSLEATWKVLTCDWSPSNCCKNQTKKGCTTPPYSRKGRS